VTSPTLVIARPRERLELALAFAGLLAWLAYTRLFWSLNALHAALPPCPFLYLTGEPCPFCGGTRAYAAMWRGDLGAAVRYYPLGPALFLLTLAAAAGIAVLLATGRAVRWPLTPVARRWAGLGAAAVLVAAWGLRLALLPLPR